MLLQKIRRLNFLVLKSAGDELVVNIGKVAGSAKRKIRTILH